MIYIYTAIYSFASFLILYNINRFISIITNSETKSNISLFTFLYVASSAAYMFIELSYDQPVVDFVLLFLNYILLLLCTGINFSFCNLKKIIYISMLYLSLDSIFSSILKFIFSIFCKNYIEEFLEIITLSLNGIIVLVITNAVITKKDKLYFQTDSIPGYVYILILVALFFSGGLIEIQQSLTNNFVQNIFNKYIIVIVIILLIFIIITLVFTCISKSYYENTSLLLEKLNYSQVAHYQDMNKLYTELREFRHDYRNHMICIQSLLENYQYDDAVDYIKEITHRELMESGKFFTGNKIADVILSVKSAGAEKINAEIQFDGCICDKIHMTDICVILSNGLDNAIEACEKIMGSHSPKIIEVNCVFSQNFQIIQISNPVEKDVSIFNNSIETTKINKTSHGIGLYNIKRTVDKYSGEFDITCKNNRFILDIGFQVCNADDKQRSYLVD